MINYIIATYAGIIDSRKNREESEKVLAIQLNELYQLFKLKKINNIQNLISKITIVIPPLKHTGYQNYYNSNITSIENIPIQYLEYKGHNKDHSYDQWLQGYINDTNSNYYLIIEDDYVIDRNNITFDIQLIDIYNNLFKDNIGYLSTLVWDKPFKHAAISNGFISKSTFETIEKESKQTILNTYYTLKPIQNYPQLKFSQLFNDYNVPQKDLTGNIEILFWDSPSNSIKDFSKVKNNEYIFLPCQSIYTKYDYNKYSAIDIYYKILN
jgi:hypothetical protein